MTQLSSAALRRLLVTAGASLAAVGSLAAAAPSYAGAVPSPAAPPQGREGDRLTVTVRDAGRGVDGTYVVRCRPSGGSHRDPAGACRALERNTQWGKDPFAAVPDGSVCTMQYGGPATAHVRGVWAGRPVDARFDRSNGCEIDRWNRLVPLLPSPGA
ncbi:SSI family serine proteinase inhibitor [Streptomyces sp. enrichment culture]|uniref:SSI family serine proteinase inhibitor n=1 Tax=Streptomyces sp. enrichment culture TaxID=1795815 RepID=UPI003F573906